MQMERKYKKNWDKHKINIKWKYWNVDIKMKTLMNVFLGPIEPALWAIDFEKGELNSTVLERMFKTTNLKEKNILYDKIGRCSMLGRSIWKVSSIMFDHAEMGRLFTYSYLSDRHSGRWIICQRKCLDLTTKKYQRNISYIFHNT